MSQTFAHMPAHMGRLLSSKRKRWDLYEAFPPTGGPSTSNEDLQSGKTMDWTLRPPYHHRPNHTRAPGMATLTLTIGRRYGSEANLLTKHVAVTRNR